MIRNYFAQAAGAGTSTIQIQGNGKLRLIQWQTQTAAAAGQVEVSTAPASQIGNAQPTPTVLARFDFDLGGYPRSQQFVADLNVKAFENVYIHSTGLGNTSNVALQVHS
jgi:hypothetical protein